MVAGIGPKLAKLLLWVFNFTIWAAGIALIVVGSIVLADQESYTDVFGENNIVALAGTTLGLGCFAFLIGFCGCRGTMKEGVGLLKLYWVLMLLTILAEITVGILAIVYSDDIEQSMIDGMKVTIDQNYEAVEGSTNAVDSFQENDECCGALNYTDYITCTNCVGEGYSVPASCCKTPETPGPCQAGTLGNPADPSLVWETGCVEIASQKVEDNYLLIGIICLCLIAFEILTMIFTCCVINAIEKGETA